MNATRFVVAALASAMFTAPARSQAILIDSTTIIDNIPIGTIGNEDGFGNPHFAVNRGDGITTGFIDAAVLLYDFGTATSVSNAMLTLNVDTIWNEASLNPTIEMFVYPDANTTIELTDINLGTGTVWDSFQYTFLQNRTIDVTAAINAALPSSQYVGFRFQNERSPFELPNALEGIHYLPVSLTFDDGLTLSLSGPCPGTVTASVTNATPGGTVAFIFASGPGSVTIPGGFVCAGTQLGLNGTAQLVGTTTADGSGNASISGNAPPVACSGVVQALDVATCSTSNVENL